MPEPDFEFVEDWDDALNAILVLPDSLGAKTEDAWEQAHPKPMKYRTMEAWERDRENFIDAAIEAAEAAVEVAGDQAAADWDSDHPKPAEQPTMPEDKTDLEKLREAVPADAPEWTIGFGMHGVIKIQAPDADSAKAIFDAMSADDLFDDGDIQEVESDTPKLEG